MGHVGLDFGFNWVLEVRRERYHFADWGGGRLGGGGIVVGSSGGCFVCWRVCLPACLFLSVFWMRQKKQKGVMLFGGRGGGEGSHSYLLTTICVCLSRLFGWREEEQYRSDVYVWGQSLGRCRNRRIGLGFLDKIQTRVWEEMRVPDGWMGRGLLVEECTFSAFVSRRETESCFCILGACTTFVHGSFGMDGRGGGRVHCWQ